MTNDSTVFGIDQVREETTTREICDTPHKQKCCNAELPNRTHGAQLTVTNASKLPNQQVDQIRLRLGSHICNSTRRFFFIHHTIMTDFFEKKTPFVIHQLECIVTFQLLQLDDDDWRLVGWLALQQRLQRSLGRNCTRLNSSSCVDDLIIRMIASQPAQVREYAKVCWLLSPSRLLFAAKRGSNPRAGRQLLTASKFTFGSHWWWSFDGDGSG